MPLFIYQYMATAISFVLVGLYYGTFSSVMRSQPFLGAAGSNDCFELTIGTQLENVLLLIFLAILIGSTMVELQRAQFLFKLITVALGILHIFMVVCIIMDQTG